jgi:hypothetical protein
MPVGRSAAFPISKKLGRNPIRMELGALGCTEKQFGVKIVAMESLLQINKAQYVGEKNA